AFITSFPLKPLVKDGVKVASTAMIVDDIKKPIIWRGPIIAKMLSDFFENTDWGNLDYLVIDLPPGTSDAPLTIMQLLDLKGFILVTTPQRISSINSLRSGLMAKRLNVGILGVIENMSTGTISDNTKSMIDALGTELLGTVKFSNSFNRYSDNGMVTVYNDAGIADEFEAISKRV
ncbi:Mrp/NBP35 family ATP-binding protein, partial [Candidatus Marsarchaeota archaeon]|nr:Mrp/NBP35 family ATP-binding protein [Candidatus Marsarchaeota archaeon]